jgi:hypothetical protein
MIGSKHSTPAYRFLEGRKGSQAMGQAIHQAVPKLEAATTVQATSIQ